MGSFSIFSSSLGPPESHSHIEVPLVATTGHYMPLILKTQQPCAQWDSPSTVAPQKGGRHPHMALVPVYNRYSLFILHPQHSTNALQTYIHIVLNYTLPQFSVNKKSPSPVVANLRLDTSRRLQQSTVLKVTQPGHPTALPRRLAAKRKLCTDQFILLTWCGFPPWWN